MPLLCLCFAFAYGCFEVVCGRAEGLTFPQLVGSHVVSTREAAGLTIYY